MRLLHNMRQNRRKFIQTTATAGSALMTSSFELFASTKKPTSKVSNNFDLRIMATNWGFAGSLDEYCAKVKRDGYDGIEIWWPLDKKTQDEMFAAVQKYQLQIGFLCAGADSDYTKHLAQFIQMIDEAATQNIQRPLYINCHSGRDHFSFEQNRKFMDHTAELAEKTGILICHETHRSRILYAAPVARQFMEKIPGLRMTLDISHWCNVHESLLQDQEETVNMALSRADHIHARIGHPEGPQVNDPRAPEWEAAVKAHFGWWDKIVEEKKKEGKRLTILTEFGPPDYMPALAYTRLPLADQWGINVYMMQLLRKRYLP